MKGFAELLAQRRIVLRGAIDDEIATTVIAQLLFLASEAPHPISVHIDSPGGPVAAGLAIRDSFDALGVPVRTHGAGNVGGVAVLILSHGEVGQRTIARHARVSLDSIISGDGGGDVVAQAAELARTQAIVDRLLAEDTEQLSDDIARDREARRRFSADEAVAYRLVDRVLM